jgi:hypothetical protein
MELKIKLHDADIRHTNLVELSDDARLSTIAVYLSNLRTVNAMMACSDASSGTTGWRESSRFARTEVIRRIKSRARPVHGAKRVWMKSRVELATRAD